MSEFITVLLFVSGALTLAGLPWSDEEVAEADDELDAFVRWLKR